MMCKSEDYRGRTSQGNKWPLIWDMIRENTIGNNIEIKEILTLDLIMKSKNGVS